MENDKQATLPNRLAEHSLHPLQVLAWRNMSYEKKWALVKQANRLLRQSVTNRIRRNFPDMPEDQVNHEASRSLLLSRP
jgi:hypothetical protein